MDTLAMASRDRKSQGPCELEISYGGELDLHRSFILCSKNPGHRKFIPVDQFNVDHLPSLYHDEDIVNAVKAAADLTVRVRVKHVSANRPKIFPHSDKPFPCYVDRGRDMERFGSGWMDRVVITPWKNCPCKECANSSTPGKKDFAEIVIKTAAHVVFDDLEGEHTTCHFFFDKGDSPDDCSNVLALSGMSWVMSDVENDSCEMRFSTHDMDLAERLNKLWCRYWDTHIQVGKKYQTEWYDKQGRLHPKLSKCLSDPDCGLTIIVSHPHGCSKQISLGRYTKRNIFVIESQFIYSTATCPGSSGAPVYVVERLGLGCSNPHSGNCEDNKELNFSAAEPF